MPLVFIMRVFVAAPRPTTVRSQPATWTRCFLSRRRVLRWNGCRSMTVWCRARNTLVAKFLESRAEHLLFVDADIGFDPLQIVAMLGQEFVAGVAPVKDYFPDGLRY